MDEGYNFRIQDFRYIYMDTGCGSGDTHACIKGVDRVGLGVCLRERDSVRDSYRGRQIV